MDITMTDKKLYARLRGTLKRDWINIPDYGYQGTGAPGLILEELLGFHGSNRDTPDAGKWEIKFLGKTAGLLTLFHLEAEPKGHMHHMVRTFGWPDAKGRTSFRHTIHGRSDRGFYITNESSQISVCNDNENDIISPYWTHDRLLNAFASKLRRLILVRGTKKNNRVKYETAYLYWEPQITLFANAIERGIVAIDFDARTNNSRGLRNHGTKFRVKYDNLHHLYNHHQKFNGSPVKENPLIN